MGDIFREIDEELRQEKAERLWRRYGKYVVVGAVAAVVAVAAYSGWQQYRESRQLEAGAKFAAAKALISEGKRDDARALFDALARESDTVYGTLARFHHAGLRIEAGDKAGGAAAFRTLAADEGLDAPLRELATILAALADADSAGGDTTAMLAPLVEADSPWRFAALEILGLKARREGRLEDAKSHFQRIVDDPDAPADARRRAAQLLSMVDRP